MEAPMMMKRTCLAVVRLLSLALLMMASSPIAAQVPQDTTFTGRLVNDSGNPIAGPVDLELRVFGSETSGTQLYSEEHLAVPIDSSGGFAVQLGLGTSPSGSFDADLFSDVDRWLEVLVGTEVLTPRQIIGSVPWALVAERANEIVPDSNAPRFEDCGDGTVADHQTGLLWEKKTGTWANDGVFCASVPCPDPHNVNNRYTWSLGAPWDPDGGAFTDFLAKLNDPVFGSAATKFDVTGCFAGHCDWRLPNIVELQTILDCVNSPCIDPIFGATSSQTIWWPYWSASTYANFPGEAWSADFRNGFVGDSYMTTGYHDRAVRAGSCN
jgi:hypothetical protein